MCFPSYGQLSMDGKTPPYMFREYRTNRLFRIYGGPSSYSKPSAKAFNDFFLPKLPYNVQRALWQGSNGSWPNIVIGSFEICPLVAEKEKSEQPQPACIESATGLTVKRFE